MRASFIFPTVLAFLAMGFSSPAAGQARYTLRDLLQLGQELNPTVQALEAGKAAREADRRDQGRLSNPVLEYAFGQGEPFEASGTRDLRELSARQTVENPLSRRYRLRALDEEVVAADEAVRSGRLAVAHQIRLHFYRILHLQEAVQLARLNEEALAEVSELMDTRARVGEVRDLEAIRLRVEHMRAQNQVSAAEMELDQSRRHLNMFLRNGLPQDYELVGELDRDRPVPDFQALVDSVVPGHPDLQAAFRNRKAAEYRWKESRLGWLPDPVFSVTSGQELDGDVLKWGLGVAVPLWNQSRAAADRDQEALLRMELEEEALALDLQAQLMIHHNHLRLLDRTLDLFREGLLEEADVSMAIAETSYREGEISLVEYLDARRTYQSIQMEFHVALFDWNREFSELDRVAGGGVL